MAESLMARFEGVRRLAALTIVLSLFVACGPDGRSGGVAPSPVLPAGTYRLSGTVTDAPSAAPMPGAVVEARIAADESLPIATTVAGPGGNYSLPAVPGVTYVRVIQYGYFDVNERVELTSDGTRNFSMARDPGLTVSGTVLEFTTSELRGPVPNLRLKVRWGGKDGPLGDLPDVVTDANGRYSILREGYYTVLYLGTAPGSEYRSLCNAWPVGLTGSGLTDLPVVHNSVHNSWSGNTRPPGMWTKFGTVRGVVSELVDGHSQPIEGATVFGEGDESPRDMMETATTNATGFYMSCSALGHGSVTLTAQKAGYIPTVRVIERGLDFEINFELTRNQASRSRQ